MTPDARGAVSVVDRIYADRLLRAKVPPVITASCLAWYGHWRDGSGSAVPETTKVALRCVEDWTAHPVQRSTIDVRIMRLAEKIAVSPHPVPFEERAV